ncbi:bifunctional Acyl-CoA N-acyltransferase/GNAT domain [Babesia duncani]|uniref:Bifunctional Acyl-CoA N-acyltransferase/GNAT domain n=1 Tax=Babesia duncani TaxID=323732 RepID=A0AAD9UMG4_9APIC|nr:bifunctional Acyl-CoA N-acyltransferase/GNAT domain [Babesia duncani]KAK2196457.1 bifunctional Acyl-CoA N-acyltransferase/GNAT domain [Babesia duncani]
MSAGDSTETTHIKRNLSRSVVLRNNKNSYLRIREITRDDSRFVCKLIFDHFRSFTFPAMIYWMVQHMHDIVVILVINSFLLPFRNLLYFCLLFLIYLYVRARYEIEKHIKHCCPDLVGVYDTYRTTKGSNFWVGYCCEQDDDLDLHTVSVESDISSSNESSSRLRREESRVRDEDAPTARDNEILGCIGITPYRNKTDVAQMVRLVVSPKCRNMRVGSRLLKHFELQAVELGYKEIRVFTNNLNTAYLHFLKQNNFEIQQIVRRGLMRGDLIIWNKVLKPELEHVDGLNIEKTEQALLSQPTGVSDATFIPE